MRKTQYVVFDTAWGPAGFRAGPGGLQCLSLPGLDRPALHRRLSAPGPAELDPSLLPELQHAIGAYFDGRPVDFGFVRIDLDRFSPFTRRVLEACRSVGYGRTITYGALAARIGRPAAARAVGTVMRRNPLPLVVPCHRVLPATGGIGGFSAPGGPALKRRLLTLEAPTPDLAVSRPARR